MQIVSINMNGSMAVVQPFTQSQKAIIQAALKPMGVTFPHGSIETYHLDKQVLNIGYDCHGSSGEVSRRVVENLLRAFPNAVCIYCNGSKVM